MSFKTKVEPTANARMATGIWIALVATLSVAGSLAFACAAPLAAIAAMAGAKMDRTSGLVLVCLAWLTNQIVGFTLLGYPQTADAFAWGAAIGAASVVAFLAVKSVTASLSSGPVGLVVSLAASFTAYELCLALAGGLLAGSAEAFSLDVIARVLAVNVIAFIGLLALHHLATALLGATPAEGTTR